MLTFTVYFSLGTVVPKLASFGKLMEEGKKIVNIMIMFSNLNVSTHV